LEDLHTFHVAKKINIIPEQKVGYQIKYVKHGMAYNNVALKILNRKNIDLKLYNNRQVTENIHRYSYSYSMQSMDDP